MRDMEWGWGCVRHTKTWYSYPDRVVYTVYSAMVRVPHRPRPSTTHTGGEGGSKIGTTLLRKGETFLKTGETILERGETVLTIEETVFKIGQPSLKTR